LHPRGPPGPKDEVQVRLVIESAVRLRLNRAASDPQRTPHELAGSKGDRIDIRRLRQRSSASVGLWMMTMIETGEQLRAYYGPPSTLGAKKDMRHIDRHARAFIEQSPFLVVSSSSPEGWPEASPRGRAGLCSGRGRASVIGAGPARKQSTA
jgi:hypothetical protein